MASEKKTEQQVPEISDNNKAAEAAKEIAKENADAGKAIASENADTAKDIVNENADAAGEKKTLTLKSNDGHEFQISESAAMLSQTIKNVVVDDCTKDVIPLHNVDSTMLARITKYLVKLGEGGASQEDLNMLHEEFLAGDGFESLCEILMAANYLDIKNLFTKVAQKIAKIMENKTPAGVRKLFGIESDYTPEEEEEMKKQFEWAWHGVEEEED